jgi:hypothetical protein
LRIGHSHVVFSFRVILASFGKSAELVCLSHRLQAGSGDR